MKKIIVILAALTGSNLYALSTANLFAGGGYGGDVKVGEMSWHVANGQAEINISLTDPNIDIWSFSFNTAVESRDFSFEVTDRERWNYRGLNSPEGIGTDLFDYTLYGPTVEQGGANALRVLIFGAALISDSDIFVPNLISGNEDWNDVAHQSHFGIGTDSGLVSDMYLIPTEVLDAHGQLRTKWVPAQYDDTVETPGSVSVPDGGSTAILLAAGLAITTLCRRRFAGSAP